MDWSVGAPVRPVAVPGAGDSPGARMRTRAKGPPEIVTGLEVFAWTETLSESRAVMVWAPLLWRRTGIRTWPFTSVVSLGIQANASVEESATRSFTPGTRFHHWSTARTVIVKGLPAVWPVGVPLFPEVVPPMAFSPGRITCRPKKGPGLTTKELLVPSFGGAEKSAHVSATAPPAPLNV